jgi:hypothetical protein
MSEPYARRVRRDKDRRAVRAVPQEGSGDGGALDRLPNDGLGEPEVTAHQGTLERGVESRARA